MELFALDATQEFGRKVAAELGVDLAAHEEREFEDGEHKARPLVSVRGHDVYVVQSLHSGPDASVNDKLCRLLFFISALKENGASRVTAVIPYIAYARKDRQTKSRDPVTTKYMACLLEAAVSASGECEDPDGWLKTTHNDFKPLVTPFLNLLSGSSLWHL